MKRLFSYITKRLSNHPGFVFAIILLSLSIFYEYHEIITKRPQSIHHWRQSDCASIALNYYQNGMDFLQPETHNQTADNGTTGYNCTSEMPLLYFSAAILYHLFGYHEALYRGLNTLLFFIGLFYLFKILFHETKSQFWAICLTLLFFTSPVLVYYGNNFLSNTTALSMSCIAWYHFLIFYRNKQYKPLYRSTFFFFLAGAFKITALLSPLAIVGLFFMEKGPFSRTIKEENKIFTNGWKQGLPFFLLFCILGIWTYYSIQFNQAHHSKYFSTTIFPIWEMNKDEIAYVFYKVSNQWLTQYYHLSLLVFFSALAILLHFKKSLLESIWQRIFVLLFGGAMVYILLQYHTLSDHDYYTINLNILPILLTIAGANYAYKYHPSFLHSKVIRGGFVILLTLNISHAKSSLSERYNGWWNSTKNYEKLHDITPYLRSLGINHTDKVISIPDESHLSLYLMNQKGWTEHVDRRAHQQKPIFYNDNEKAIQKSIDKGAKYLVINGLYELIQKPYLNNFTTHLLGTYNHEGTSDKNQTVYIFDLLDTKPNFKAPERHMKWKAFCNAELLSSDKNNYVSISDSNVFENQNSQSSNTAYSGKHSVSVSQKNPFSLKHTIEKVRTGESVKVEIMRKKNNSNAGFLVVSGDGYYSKESKRSKSDNTEWEKLTTEVFIDNQTNEKPLSIYVWNPSKDTVYFDDLKITYFKAY